MSAHETTEGKGEPPLHSSGSAQSVQSVSNPHDTASAVPSDREASSATELLLPAGLAASASATSVYSNQWSDAGEGAIIEPSGSAASIDRGVHDSVPASVAPSTVASEADLHVLRNNSSNASIS